MNDDFKEDIPQISQGDAAEVEEISPPKNKPNLISRWLETLVQMGLGESVLRFGTNALALMVVVVTILLMQRFYRDLPNAVNVQGALAAGPTATPVVQVNSVVAPPIDPTHLGIPRLALIHTTIPSRPRIEVTKYTVQPGDTLFGIAEKYGLKPETILFGNYYTLWDDPHSLSPGQELNILPVDGTYYEWQAGDGLNGVAKFFGVNAEDILNYPANHLDPKTIGDYTKPNIKAGTWLVIPGGSREFVWGAPVGVTRSDPALARVLGPGSCGKIEGGAVGFGTFVWPANKHFLSGYDFSDVHKGIDIAGSLGEAVYAVDAGVIVYAGWNDYGYGNMIMIDHGNGWQSLYAHLSGINVLCGQSVGQGAVIGAIGSTGRSSGAHLHFELMHTQYGKVNPWNFLPPP